MRFIKMVLLAKILAVFFFTSKVLDARAAIFYFGKKRRALAVRVLVFPFTWENGMVSVCLYYQEIVEGDSSISNNRTVVCVETENYYAKRKRENGKKIIAARQLWMFCCCASLAVFSEWFEWKGVVCVLILVNNTAEMDGSHATVKSVLWA